MSLTNESKKQTYDMPPEEYWGIIEIDEYSIQNIHSRKVTVKIWTEYKNGNIILCLTDKDKKKLMSKKKIKLDDYEHYLDLTFDGYIKKISFTRCQKYLSKEEKKQIKNIRNIINDKGHSGISELEEEGILFQGDNNWIINGPFELSEPREYDY